MMAESTMIGHNPRDDILLRPLLANRMATPFALDTTIAVVTPENISFEYLRQTGEAGGRLWS